MIGHLLWKCNGIDEDSMDEVAKEAASLGKESLKYAWVLDSLPNERDRSQTIDLNMWQLESENYMLSLANAPGDKDLVKNMTTGMAQADVGILVVDASKGNFEASMTTDGSTQEHVLLAYALGVKQMIVAVNKMETWKYSEARYQEVRNDVAEYLRKVGYKPMAIPFVPISAWEGENLSESSDIMPWYKGPCLLEALDQCTLPKRSADKPLRIPIRDVHKIGGVGTVAVGRVETGTLKVGAELIFAPTGATAVVKSIEVHREPVDTAYPGDNVGFHVTGVSWKDLKRGYVASEIGDNQAVTATAIEVQAIIMNHPGKISTGYHPTMDCHTAHLPVSFSKILQKLDRRTGEVIEENPSSVEMGDACTVVLIPSKPLCVEPFQTCPPLGRFAIRDQKQTVAVGVVKKIVSTTPVSDNEEAK